MPLDQRLPRTAVEVVHASHGLTPGLKLVWEKVFFLDQGPEGAWISASNLADRLAMSQHTVEVYRRRLMKLGLQTSRQRKGARSWSWYATLPTQCVPLPDSKPLDWIALARLLDRHISDVDNRTPEYAVKERNSTPPCTAAMPCDVPQAVHGGVPRIEAELRGRGGEKGSPSKSVDQTLSASPGKRGGEGSNEPQEAEQLSGPLADIMARWRHKPPERQVSR